MLKSNRLRVWSLLAAGVLAHATGSRVMAHVLANETDNTPARLRLPADWATSGRGRLKIIDRSTGGDDSPSIASLLAAVLSEMVDSDAAKVAPPTMADGFAPFKDQLKFHWDDRWFYIESDGMPSHNMMVGITAWQQQVPLPKSYTGENAWRIPLHPVPAKNPVSIKGRFLRGAIAIAVNGIPIFNPQNNRGEVSQEIGELDQWGGHCGRGDDYHYHAAPIFLEKTVGPGKPIAFALDGYPIYGSTGPGGLPVDEKTLDAFRGKADARGNYAYFASTKYPYVNGGFHGEVSEVDGQVDPQPSGRGIRPAMPPLRGARITGFTRSQDSKTFSLKYEVNGEARFVNYTISDDLVKFDFIDGRGQVTTQTYPLKGWARGPGGSAPGPGIAIEDQRESRSASVRSEATSKPSAAGAPFTDNHNGTVTDNFTGLMWQQADNGESTWEKALAGASTLRLAGYEDWRLPSLVELFSLSNHNNNPAIDLNYFPGNPKQPAGYWWTSEARGPDRVWVVNRGGGTGAKPKDETISAGGMLSYNARYVRGARRPVSHHYINNNDGTITDLDSGLMWVQSPGPSMSWDAAISYAKGLPMGGHKDWRLPDVKELATLIDFGILNSSTSASGLPCINRTFFPDAKAAFYWSSTILRSRSAAEAWYVDFDSGSVRYQVFSSKNLVLAVRTASPAASLIVGGNSYFHPEDVSQKQPAEGGAGGRPGHSVPGGGPTERPGEPQRGGPGGGFHLIPRSEEEKLNLTDEQFKQIEGLATETKNKLGKILTPEQLKVLQDSRPPRLD